jgi:hypothetical protein
MKADRSDICTYCGEPGKLTDDHVIQRAVWIGPSKDRPPKAKSCEECNHHSNESLFKSFMVLFDERRSRTRAKELVHPKSRGDLRDFLTLCYVEPIRSASDPFALIRELTLNPVVPDEKITKLLKKMCLGLRRHLLTKVEPRVEWQFVSPDSLRLFTVRQDGDNHKLFELPLHVGPANRYFPWPGEFPPLKFTRQGRFRDFRFGMVGDEWLELRYDRTWCGNQLHVLCWIGRQQVCLERLSSAG